MVWRLPELSDSKNMVISLQGLGTRNHRAGETSSNLAISQSSTHHTPPQPFCYFPCGLHSPSHSVQFLQCWLFPTGDSVCTHLPTLVLRSRILLPWRWRRYVPPKRRSTQDLHSATSQKTTFFMVTAVKASKLTIFKGFKRAYFGVQIIGLG
jgi:hypothetical protein